MWVLICLVAAAIIFIVAWKNTGHASNTNAPTVPHDMLPELPRVANFPNHALAKLLQLTRSKSS